MNNIERGNDILLRIDIMHYENALSVQKISDDDKVLAQHDKETGMIDFEPCRSYIGSMIRVNHKYPDDIGNYSISAELIGVIKDPETGLKSIQYRKIGDRL